MASGRHRRRVSVGSLMAGDLIDLDQTSAFKEDSFLLEPDVETDIFKTSPPKCENTSAPLLVQSEESPTDPRAETSSVPEKKEQPAETKPKRRNRIRRSMAWDQAFQIDEGAMFLRDPASSDFAPLSETPAPPRTTKRPAAISIPVQKAFQDTESRPSSRPRTPESTPFSELQSNTPIPSAGPSPVPQISSGMRGKSVVQESMAWNKAFQEEKDGVFLTEDLPLVQSPVLPPRRRSLGRGSAQIESSDSCTMSESRSRRQRPTVTMSSMVWDRAFQSSEGILEVNDDDQPGEAAAAQVPTRQVLPSVLSSIESLVSERSGLSIAPTRTSTTSLVDDLESEVGTLSREASTVEDGHVGRLLEELSSASLGTPTKGERRRKQPAGLHRPSATAVAIEAAIQHGTRLRLPGKYNPNPVPPSRPKPSSQNPKPAVQTTKPSPRKATPSENSSKPSLQAPGSSGPTPRPPVKNPRPSPKASKPASSPGVALTSTVESRGHNTPGRGAQGSEVEALRAQLVEVQREKDELAAKVSKLEGSGEEGPQKAVKQISGGVGEQNQGSVVKHVEKKGRETAAPGRLPRSSATTRGAQPVLSGKTLLTSAQPSGPAPEPAREIKPEAFGSSLPGSRPSFLKRPSAKKDFFQAPTKASPVKASGTKRPVTNPTGLSKGSAGAGSSVPSATEALKGLPGGTSHTSAPSLSHNTKTSLVPNPSHSVPTRSLLGKPAATGGGGSGPPRTGKSGTFSISAIQAACTVPLPSSPAGKPDFASPSPVQKPIPRTSAQAPSQLGQSANSLVVTGNLNEAAELPKSEASQAPRQVIQRPSERAKSGNAFQRKLAAAGGSLSRIPSLGSSRLKPPGFKPPAKLAAVPPLSQIDPAVIATACMIPLPSSPKAFKPSSMLPPGTFSALPRGTFSAAAVAAACAIPLPDSPAVSRPISLLRPPSKVTAALVRKACAVPLPLSPQKSNTRSVALPTQSLPPGTEQLASNKKEKESSRASMLEDCLVANETEDGGLKETGDDGMEIKGEASRTPELCPCEASSTEVPKLVTVLPTNLHLICKDQTKGESELQGSEEADLGVSEEETGKEPLESSDNLDGERMDGLEGLGASKADDSDGANVTERLDGAGTREEKDALGSPKGLGGVSDGANLVGGEEPHRTIDSDDAERLTAEPNGGSVIHMGAEMDSSIGGATSVPTRKEDLFASETDNSEPGSTPVTITSEIHPSTASTKPDVIRDALPSPSQTIPPENHMSQSPLVLDRPLVLSSSYPDSKPKTLSSSPMASVLTFSAERSPSVSPQQATEKPCLPTADEALCMSKIPPTLLKPSPATGGGHERAQTLPKSPEMSALLGEVALLRKEGKSAEERSVEQGVIDVVDEENRGSASIRNVLKEEGESSEVSTVEGRTIDLLTERSREAAGTAKEEHKVERGISIGGANKARTGESKGRQNETTSEVLPGVPENCQKDFTSEVLPRVQEDSEKELTSEVRTRVPGLEETERVVEKAEPGQEAEMDVQSCGGNTGEKGSLKERRRHVVAEVLPPLFSEEGDENPGEESRSEEGQGDMGGEVLTRVQTLEHVAGSMHTEEDKPGGESRTLTIGLDQTSDKPALLIKGTSLALDVADSNSTLNGVGERSASSVPFPGGVSLDSPVSAAWKESGFGTPKRPSDRGGRVGSGLPVRKTPLGRPQVLARDVLSDGQSEEGGETVPEKDGVLTEAFDCDTGLETALLAGIEGVAVGVLTDQREERLPEKTQSQQLSVSSSPESSGLNTPHKPSPRKHSPKTPNLLSLAIPLFENSLTPGQTLDRQFDNQDIKETGARWDTCLANLGRGGRRVSPLSQMRDPPGKWTPMRRSAEDLWGGAGTPSRGSPDSVLTRTPGRLKNPLSESAPGLAGLMQSVMDASARKEGKAASISSPAVLGSSSVGKPRARVPARKQKPLLSPVNVSWDGEELEERIRAIEAAGETALSSKSGRVKSSPPDKKEEAPANPYSPVKKRECGPFDCTKKSISM